VHGNCRILIPFRRFAQTKLGIPVFVFLVVAWTPDHATLPTAVSLFLSRYTCLHFPQHYLLNLELRKSGTVLFERAGSSDLNVFPDFLSSRLIVEHGQDAHLSLWRGLLTTPPYRPQVSLFFSRYTCLPFLRHYSLNLELRKSGTVLFRRAGSSDLNVFPDFLSSRSIVGMGKTYIA